MTFTILDRFSQMGVSLNSSCTSAQSISFFFLYFYRYVPLENHLTKLWREVLNGLGKSIGRHVPCVITEGYISLTGVLFLAARAKQAEKLFSLFLVCGKAAF